MHIVRSHTFKRALAIGIGAAVGILYAFSAIAANAESMPNVMIAHNGQVAVRGATVTSVHGDEIIAISNWGTSKIVWKIEVTSATRLVPERTEERLSSIIQPHEIIGFSGLIDQRGGAFVVYASTVRNESVMHDATVLDGSVIDSGSDHFVMQTENGTSTIVVGTGTIMTKDGNKALLADLVPGAAIKAFGTLNVRERVLTASRVVSVTEQLPKMPNTGNVEQSGWFHRVMAWIGQGGPLSAK